MNKFSIAIHGGAGTILKSAMTDELELAYRKGLQSALDAGYAVLEKGASSLEAVKQATIVLEDNILFNAGRGSVFTNKGLHEMDASIMNGFDLSAGAVAGVTKVRNPVELAYKVMTNSSHVLLCGEGADEFAREQNIKEEEGEYFFSQFRYNQWLDIRESGEYTLDHSDTKENGEKKFGTVGAVACDINGNIAAATSTGGMTNKKYGRAGDSPLIGCGTYANNKTCAISATGHGELFIKAVAAYDVSCLIEYKGLSLQEAMNIVVNDKLVKINGEGGMIGVDAKGNMALLFNCEGMYRGWKSSNGTDEVAIYR
ncbi:MAG: isoaspartyl peptidase/L-asparaginase [Sphingobacteriales bacterium]|nr:isoaspartyl peptidase/L-asparaginase [Sphingobacteriales bacterium]